MTMFRPGRCHRETNRLIRRLNTASKKNISCTCQCYKYSEPRACGKKAGCLATISPSSSALPPQRQIPRSTVDTCVTVSREQFHAAKCICELDVWSFTCAFKKVNIVATFRNLRVDDRAFICVLRRIHRRRFAVQRQRRQAFQITM
jgi:hypothetical protein